MVEKEYGKIWTNIVLCGYPGAGKNAYAKLLEEHYGLISISTGKLIEDEIHKGSEVGKIAEAYMQKGDIVPDEIAIRMIEQKIQQTKNAKGFVFKGFPSNFVQAYILDGILKKADSSITCVINIEASPIQCLKRLSARGKSEHARIYDTNNEVIIHRLETHERNWPKVQEYYQKQGILYNLSDGLEKKQAIEEIHKITQKAITKI